jgi:hypothetical protein
MTRTKREKLTGVALLPYQHSTSHKVSRLPDKHKIKTIHILVKKKTTHSDQPQTDHASRPPARTASHPNGLRFMWHSRGPQQPNARNIWDTSILASQRCLLWHNILKKATGYLGWLIMESTEIWYPSTGGRYHVKMPMAAHN